MDDSPETPLSQTVPPDAPWRWVLEFAERMALLGDQRRHRLVLMAHEALAAREMDPPDALRLYTEGRAEAERLRERWWVLFFDWLRLQVIVGEMDDYATGREIVVWAVEEARKPLYGRFPQRICLQEDLLRIHLGSDPLGYAGVIEEGIGSMGHVLPELSPCRECLQTLRTRRAVALGRWGEARVGLLKSLNDDRVRHQMPPQSERHWVAQTFSSEKSRAAELTQLCLVAWHTQEYDDLRAWAAQGESVARLVGQQGWLAEFQVWQALLARRDGSEPLAQRLCNNAVLEAKRSTRMPADAYFTALCTFYEQGGDLRRACQARVYQLHLLRGKGQTFVEVHAHLEQCRLLARLGHSLATALPAARLAALSLIDPSPALEQLDRIARGSA